MHVDIGPSLVFAFLLLEGTIVVGCWLSCSFDAHVAARARRLRHATDAIFAGAFGGVLGATLGYALCTAFHLFAAGGLYIAGGLVTVMTVGLTEGAFLGCVTWMGELWSAAPERTHDRHR